MSSRKLRVLSVQVSEVGPMAVGGKATGVPITELKILFSRKLTQLEVSGVRAVLEGEIK